MRKFRQPVRVDLMKQWLAKKIVCTRLVLSDYVLLHARRLSFLTPNKIGRIVSERAYTVTEQV